MLALVLELNVQPEVAHRLTFENAHDAVSSRDEQTATESYRVGGRSRQWQPRRMDWRFEIVFLARHAQTEWNRERRRQGQLDSPLTHVGIEQAANLARVAGTHSMDGIFTSPLGRARLTAATISASVGVAVEVMCELAEVHHGRFAGLSDDDMEDHHPGVLAQRALNKYLWRFPGGESYRDADERGYRALQQVQARGSRRPLFVTHEMVGLMLLRRLLDLPPDVALKRSLPQGVMLEVVPARKAVRELGSNKSR